VTEKAQSLIKASDMRTYERQTGASVRAVFGDDHGVDLIISPASYLPGVGPEEHRHSCGEVFYVLDGRGAYTVDGVDVVAEAGDIVVVPPNTWHRFHADGDKPLQVVAVFDSTRVNLERRPT
jgi:quercetin dioxygenase-like cupin family protein